MRLPSWTSLHRDVRNNDYYYMYYYYYPRCQDTLHLQNLKPEKYCFKNYIIILYEENLLPQSPTRYIVVAQSNIIVLEPLNL
jgi:hypothetical protein